MSAAIIAACLEMVGKAFDPGLNVGGRGKTGLFRDGAGNSEAAEFSDIKLAFFL